MGQFTRQINTMFVVLQTILYVAFLTMDLTGGNVVLSSYLKFSIIILCFCYALFSKNSADRSILFCLKAALLFTLISDFFILILDYYYYGVLTFIIVQQLYSIRLSLADRQMGRIKNVLIRLALQLCAASIVCLILKILGVKLEGLLIASTFYFICILTNTMRALKVAIANTDKKGMVLFAIGMLLFLCCDINVGLFNLSGYISLPRDIETFIYSVTSILMWTFYAPSQVLIVLSVQKK